MYGTIPRDMGIVMSYFKHWCTATVSGFFIRNTRATAATQHPVTRVKIMIRRLTACFSINAAAKGMMIGQRRSAKEMYA